MRRLSLCVLFVFALVQVQEQVALGQGTGTGAGTGSGAAKPPTSGSGSTGSSSTGKPTLPDPTNDPFSKNTNGIQGRLIPNPSTRVMVDLYQQGSRIDTAVTNSDGTFSFPRARNNDRYEIRIDLGNETEFRDEIDFQPGYPTIVQINVPAHLHSKNPDKKASEGVISLVNLMAPKKAVQEFEKGRELGLKKKYDEGMEHLQKAVGIYPKYPDAYNEMGLIEKRQDHLPQAAELFNKAIETDPKWTAPYMNLVQIQMVKKEYANMLLTTERVIELDNNLGAAHFYRAVGLLSTNKIDAAEKEALLAAKDDRRSPQVELLLGNICEMRGDTADAVVHYRLYLKQAPEASNFEKLTAHLTDLEHPEKVAKAGNP